MKASVCRSCEGPGYLQPEGLCIWCVICFSAWWKPVTGPMTLPEKMVAIDEWLEKGRPVPAFPISFPMKEKR